MPKSSKPRRTRGGTAMRATRPNVTTPRTPDRSEAHLTHDPRAHGARRTPDRGDGRPHRFPGRTGGR